MELGASFDVTGNGLGGLIFFSVFFGNFLQKRPFVENSPVLLLVALPHLFYQLMMRFHFNVKDCHPFLFRTILF